MTTDYQTIADLLREYQRTGIGSLIDRALKLALEADLAVKSEVETAD